ncbi:MAG: type II secretion system protein GspG [Burkholderiales bacterium]
MSHRRVAALAFAVICLGFAAFFYVRSDEYCERDVNCAQLRRIHNTLDLYKLETGAYPANLSVLLKPAGDWKPPQRFDASAITDQWGHAIVFISNPSPPPRARLVIQARGRHSDNRGPSEDIVREIP